MNYVDDDDDECGARIVIDVKMVRPKEVSESLWKRTRTDLRLRQ